MTLRSATTLHHPTPTFSHPTHSSHLTLEPSTPPPVPFFPSRWCDMVEEDEALERDAAVGMDTHEDYPTHHPSPQAPPHPHHVNSTAAQSLTASTLADSISILGAVLDALGFALLLVTIWFGRRDRKLNYYEEFKAGRALPQAADSDIQQVEDARRLLAGFWDWVTDVYDSGSFPIGFLSSRRSTWLSRGNNYHVTVEPFDIANWYARFHAQEVLKHYLRNNAAGECPRPRRYYLLQELHRQVYNCKDDKKMQSSLVDAWEELYGTQPTPEQVASAHSLSSDYGQPLKLRVLDNLT
eukprot:jgi/Chlat1/3547/Chrsp231S03549